MDLGRNPCRPVGELQGARRLLLVVRMRRHCRDHDCTCATAKRVLEEARKWRLSVRNVLAGLVGQRRDTVAEGGEGGVDLNELRR